MSALKQLTIQGFRGAIKPFALRFDPEQRVTVVYGENASGKSTICDALEFLGRGKVGSLDNRGLGQTTRYWPALGHALTDVSISLETSDGSCTATITRNGEVLVLPPEDQPRVEVFRRSEILSLIEAKPGERYAAISRFIDVSGIETSEAALREVIRDLAKQRDGAAARLSENERIIQQFWETEGSPSPDAFTWAEIECSQGNDGSSASEKEISAIRALQTAFTRLLDLPSRLRSAQQSLTTAKTAADTASAAVQDQLQNVAADAGEAVGVLEAASAYLAKHPSAEVCPVCESSEKSRDLANRIRERLEAFSSLKSAQSQVTASAQAVQRAEQQLQLIRENARQDVAKFEASRADSHLPAGLPMPDSAIPNSASGLSTWLSATSSLAIEWKRVETARHDKRQFVNTLRQALETWKVNQAALDDLQQLLPRLERALKIVEEERRRFTDDILSQIAGEVSRLYDLVHPGEGINKIRLELDPKKRASLEIGANFCGQPTRPQGYFSESHLDTLGLCVFLALSALDQPDQTIVVLDDILSSVDDDHSQRIFKMLRSEASRFRHCIITTHSRTWKESHSQCQFVELGRWSPESGLQRRHI